MLRLVRLAAAAVCAFPLSALAADPTAQQADALRQELRGWLGNLLGPRAQLPDELLSVTPEGDHYRVSVRLNAIPGLATLQGGEIAVAARPLPAGRWMLYHMSVPSPLRLHMELPPGVPAGAAGRPPTPLDLTLGFGNVEWHGVLDPSLASPSVVSARLDGYDFDTTSGPIRQSGRAGEATGSALITPSAGGRVDFSEQSAAADLGITTKGPNAEQSVAMFIGHAEAGGKISGLDPARLSNLTELWAEASSPEPRANAQAASVAPAAKLRDAYLKLRGIAEGGNLFETLSDLRLLGAGHIADIGQLIFGGAVDTGRGILAVHLIFSVDGIAAPDIPPPIRRYVPRHVLIRPSLSGISLADLDALIMAATAPGVTPSMAEPGIAQGMRTVFAHGGITAGIDELQIDVGPARLAGSGKVVALAPNHFRGEAVLSATGLDPLLAELRTDREWGKFAPFLQLAAMLGEHHGERIVWRIKSDNTDVQVNGLDVPALIAAGKELERH